MTELTQEQAVKHYTEFMRRIQVGAYEERSSEHYETGTWPEDGVEESVHNLETWARKQGLAFHWIEGTYKLEPMSEEEKAAYEQAQRLQDYRVALWPSALSPLASVVEKDVLAEDAKGAAIVAMQWNGTKSMGVVVVMSATQQETFYDVQLHTGQNALVYSRTAIAPRPVADYNRAIDERNAINMANREKPWLPLHDGE